MLGFFFPRKKMFGVGSCGWVGDGLGDGLGGCRVSGGLVECWVSKSFFNSFYGVSFFLVFSPQLCIRTKKLKTGN